MHNSPEQNQAFRQAFDATNARWKAQAAIDTVNHTSTKAEIVHYYDTHLNLTLAELASMTGRSIAQLKRMIMRGAA